MTEPTKHSAESQAARGFAWLGSVTAVTRVLDLASIFVVLRMLDTEDIGEATLALAIAAVIEPFVGTGVATAVIQRKTLPAQVLATAYWWVIVTGIMAIALCCGAGLAMGLSYGNTNIAVLTAVSALQLLFLIPLRLRGTLLTRQLRFPTLARVQVSNTLVESTFKITLALTGTGPWALVVPAVCKSITRAIFFVRLVPRFPRPRKDTTTLKELLEFGVPSSLSRGVELALKNVDYFWVNHFFGTAGAGTYRVFFEIMMTPLESVLRVSLDVAFPLYARVRSSVTRLQLAFAGVARKTHLLALPFIVSGVAFGKEITALVKPGLELPSNMLLIALGIAAVLRTQAALYPQLLEAIGKPRWPLYYGIATLSLYSIVFASLRSLFPSMQLETAALAWGITYTAELSAWVFGITGPTSMSRTNLLANFAYFATLFALGTSGIFVDFGGGTSARTISRLGTILLVSICAWAIHKHAGKREVRVEADARS